MHFIPDAYPILSSFFITFFNDSGVHCFKAVFSFPKRLRTDTGMSSLVAGHFIQYFTSSHSQDLLTCQYCGLPIIFEYVNSIGKHHRTPNDYRTNPLTILRGRPIFLCTKRYNLRNISLSAFCSKKISLFFKAAVQPPKYS